MHLYQAHYIYPVSSAPLTDGIVATEGEQIVAVGPAGAIMQRFPGCPISDLGAAMLFPQAVNAHTHLDRTAFAAFGQTPDIQRGFVQWINELVTMRRATPLAVIAEGAREGLRLILESGTAAVGDFSNNLISVEPLVNSGLYGVVYYQLTGPNPQDAPRLLQQAQEQVQRWRSMYGEARIRFGVALQSPYAVSPDLFRLVVNWVIQDQIPSSVHIAESPAEVEFLLHGTGEILDYLSTRYAFAHEWIPTPGCSPIQYLEQLGVLSTHPLLVHGVQVTHNDIEVLAAHRVPMTHCARSNAQLDCGRMPIECYREGGVPLAMGTDSLASSPSLSLWDEARAALKLHHAAGVSLDPHVLLQLCTLDSARAIGFEALLGSLEPGKAAHLAIGRQLSSTGIKQLALTPDEMLQLLWDGEIAVTAFTA